MHQRHDQFGWSDHAKRREFERLHNGAPIEPLYGPRTTPLWCWALMGIAVGLLATLHFLGDL